MSDDSARPRPPRALGFCRACARSVHDQSFSDAAGLREYIAYGTCQVCQDCLDLNPRDADDAHTTPTPVLHGVVFAAAVDGPEVREVALLPFQYDPWHAGFEYEPGDIVRAGAALAPLDPFVELAALRPAWAGRFERVLSVASLSDPVLRVRTAHNHMVIAVDGVSATAAERLNPGLGRPPLVELSAAVRWRDAFGAPLDELLRTHGAGGPLASLSPLRQAALGAGLLELRAPAGPRQGCPVLDHILLGMTPPDALTTDGPCDAPH